MKKHFPNLKHGVLDVVNPTHCAFGRQCCIDDKATKKKKKRTRIGT
jgi:hypothetical protein